MICLGKPQTFEGDTSSMTFFQEHPETNAQLIKEAQQALFWTICRLLEICFFSYVQRLCHNMNELGHEELEEFIVNVVDVLVFSPAIPELELPKFGLVRINGSLLIVELTL